MRYIFIFCLFIMSSCIIRPWHYNSYTSTYIPPVTTYSTTSIITPSPFILSPTYTVRTWTPFWTYRPKTYSLGNVYNHHHHHYHNNPRPRTNLPLQNGPMGGRRK